MTQEADITYFPESGQYIRGYHEELPYSGQLLATTSRKEDKEGKSSYSTNIVDPGMQGLVGAIKENKDRIKLRQLTAADFEAYRPNLEPLTLIRLYNRILGEQEEWFHLDNMFNTIQLDKLLYRMPFRDNPAVAQEVARRERYDITAVKYDEINFDLPKIVTSYDIALEDPLRTMINPVDPLNKSDKYAMAHYREMEALAALQQIGAHYHRDETGSARFSSTTAPNDDDGKIADPSALGASATHSTNKPVNQIQLALNGFIEEFDMHITHIAVSPATVMELAQNTWTAPNTIFNVEAYRTQGGTRPFPGLSGVTAVISQVVPDKTLYAACKPNNLLVKAEGPKIMKTWEDHTRFTTQWVTADFHQYKCAHSDLSLDRKFGMTMTLA